MKNASFSLAETKFAMGDINHLVIQNVNKAQIKVRTKKDNVAGKAAAFYANIFESRQLDNLRFASGYVLIIILSLCFTGVTLPIFEHYADGSDSKSNQRHV